VFIVATDRMFPEAGAPFKGAVITAPEGRGGPLFETVMMAEI
jgi:hypothetical protein